MGSSTPKVLLVDDEKIIRSLFRKTLESMDIPLMEAKGGQEALGLLEEQQFDLVITDVRMPHIDGIDLLRAVKEKSQPTEVIMMTGYANEDAAIEAVRLGAYDFLKKPFEDMQTVKRVIRNALEKQSLQNKNLHLVEDLRKKVVELQVLYELSDKLAEVSCFSQLASILLDALEKLTPYKVAALVFTGNCQNSGLVRARCKISDRELESIKACLNDALSELTGSHAAIAETDIEFNLTDNDFVSDKPLDLAGAVTIPLGNSGKAPSGVLWIAGETGGGFSPDEGETLYMLADRLAKSIGRICEERIRQQSANQMLRSSNQLLDAQNDELKKINEELLCANGELEQANRELKTAHAKLLQQEKMASIGMLAAGVAHEINNPIGYIHSNMGTLLKYVDKIMEMFQIYDAIIEETATHVGDGCRNPKEKIETKKRELRMDYVLEDLAALARESSEGTTRVKKIVADLKNFSHADDEKPAHADINELLETTLNIVWNELKYKTEVTKNYADLPLVRCYPMQLNQVFMNLLVNAAQAIEKQGRIDITTRQEGDNVIVSIADDGCGIPGESLPKIYDPFFTTKPVDKGTGLGLSVACDIIQRHQGKIEVKSQAGVGTEFTLTIPMSEDHDAQTQDSPG